MIFTIYALIDPATGEPRYIGQTRVSLADRLRTHYKKGPPTHKTNWLTKLKQQGLRPVIRELYKCYDGNTADAAEIFFIANFKERGFKLTNISLGGANGIIVHSAESKAKMSSSKAGKKLTETHRARVVAALRGRPVSEETRAKMRATALRRSPEAKAKAAAARLGSKASAEAKANMRAAHLGQKPSPEAIAKGIATRKANSQVWHSAETKAKIGAANRGRKAAPETLAALRASHLGKKQSPEQIAKRLATQKANREAKKLAEASNTNV